MGEFLKDVDDGLAVIMALNSFPKIEVVALSAVYGNTKLRHVTSNLNNLKNFFPEIDPFPKIIVGAEGKQAWINREKLPGIIKMAEIILRQKEKITIVAIGPLTNIALIFYHYPEIIPKIDKLVIMGGKLNGWEFNFGNDVPSTNFVLNLEIPTFIFGLEVCCAQMFNTSHYNILRQKSSKRAKHLLKSIRGWLILNRSLHLPISKAGFYPFDPTAIAYLLQPTIYKFISIPVIHKSSIIKTENPIRPIRGCYIDKKLWQKRQSLKPEEKRKWVNWAIKVDSPALMNLILAKLE